MNSQLGFFCCAIGGVLALMTAALAQNDVPAEMQRVELRVEGVAREALVYAPASAKT